MMEALSQIQKFSGIISIAVVWLVLIGYPYLHRDLGFQKETISALSAKKNNVLRAITTALVIGCFFQMYFLLYMNNKFALGLTSIGSLLYVSMGIATLAATLFNSKHNPNIHFWSTAYYFVVAPVTMVVIGYESVSYNSWILALSSLLSILYVLVNMYLFIRYRGSTAAIEIYCFFVLSLWTLFITFI
jgi:hypothetical protein